MTEKKMSWDDYYYPHDLAERIDKLEKKIDELYTSRLRCPFCNGEGKKSYLGSFVECLNCKGKGVV